jgi:UPF0755 protein
MDEAPGTEILFQIKQGESTMDIASKLELNRIIENKYSFYLKTKLQKLQIMAGTYKVNSAMTYDEILTVITDYSASIIKDNPEEGKSAKDKSETNSDKPADTSTDTEADE